MLTDMWLYSVSQSVLVNRPMWYLVSLLYASVFRYLLASCFPVNMYDGCKTTNNALLNSFMTEVKITRKSIISRHIYTFIKYLISKQWCKRRIGKMIYHACIVFVDSHSDIRISFPCSKILACLARKCGTYTLKGKLDRVQWHQKTPYSKLNQSYLIN